MFNPDPHVVTLKRPVRIDGRGADPLDRRLEVIGTPVSFAPGRTILADEEPAEAIYLIKGGLARVSKILPDGRRHIIDFLGRGEVFGLCGNRIHPHLVEAETAVSCVKVPRGALGRLIDDERDIAPLIVALAERRCIKYERKLVAMGCLCSVERLAHFLAWLADTGDPDGPAGEGGHVHIPMTRREIADYLGLTLETVCRAFTRLKDLGLVAMESSTDFSIPDRTALDAFIYAERP